MMQSPATSHSVPATDSSSVCDKCFQCGKSASQLEEGKLMRCGACKQALYCGKQCQKQHWKASHKLVCKAAEPVQGGDGSASRRDPTECGNCGKPAAELKRPLSICSRCYNIGYCSDSCRSAHWPTHKAACKRPDHTGTSESVKELVKHRTSASTSRDLHMEPPFGLGRFLRRTDQMKAGLPELIQKMKAKSKFWMLPLEAGQKRYALAGKMTEADIKKVLNAKELGSKAGELTGGTAVRWYFDECEPEGDYNWSNEHAFQLAGTSSFRALVIKFV